MMSHEFFSTSELSRFRANEEDVAAYVQTVISKSDKQEILSWINHLSASELQALIIPYITEKMTEDLAEKELG